MSIILITGGARSGKSRFAEQLCIEHGGTVAYIATAQVTDEDMADRIRKHQAQRPSHWTTIEQYKDFNQISMEAAFRESDVLLLDCVTIMVTNLMFDWELDYDTCDWDAIQQVEMEILQQVDQLIDVIREHDKQLVMVTNEVGDGVVPAYRLGNIFRDIAGRVNQHIARHADEVYHVVVGLPQRLK